MTTSDTSSIRLRNVVIEKHTAMRGGYRKLVLHAPEIAPLVKPGQFAHLRVPNLRDRLLRRPFSIFKAEDEYLTIIYKVVGVGTNVLSNAPEKKLLSILAPLGNGFPVPNTTRLPVLIGGGYGAAALYMTAKTSPVKGIAFFGGRSAEDILCVADFETLGWKVHLATEDGSLGEKGLVTDTLDRWLINEGCNLKPEFFTCGPHGMLRAVALRAMNANCKAWISMDRHMGCGVGACLACVQKIRTADDNWDYMRICKDGPVFECRDIHWDDTKETT